MRYGLFAGLAGFLVIAAVQAADGKLPPHPAGQQGAAPVAPVSAERIRQRVAQHQAEVKRLEQDVARQESESKQASQHLQQQDETIAELQKQLDVLHAKAPAGQP